MACSSISAPITRTLSAIAAIARFEYFIEWTPCTGLNSFIAVLKHKNVTGNFRGQVVAQWAVVRVDNPDGSPSSYGSPLSGAGETFVASGDLRIP